MAFIDENCSLYPLSRTLGTEFFDCDHDDLNDFFANDCDNYSSELLGKSYCFTLDSDPKEIVCAFTISNDSLKSDILPNSRRKVLTKSIPSEKRMRNYPAVLIGRLGVSVKYKRQGIGNELMDFIKFWFVSPENKTGCRFIIVDSYNEPAPLLYYEKNGFKTLFSSEAQERQYFNMTEDESLKSRLLFFDLIVLK